MKRNYVYFLFTCLLTFVVSGCDTDIEPEVIQAANTYNEEYYQNLREYKKTDHAICFGWYAGYTSEASPSQGLHFTGLRIVWTLSVCGQVFLPTIRLM